jgi:trans-aconitate 2-methyltransferase
MERSEKIRRIVGHRLYALGERKVCGFLARPGPAGDHGESMWDVDQYERFRRERARPFEDLLARVHPARVERAVDLGCGTGELTATICERWPEVRVTGVDTSPEMLAKASERAIPGRLAFENADAAAWRPDGPVDLVLSNAALHWVPDHARLIPRLAGMLAPGGVLAVQMPNNFDAPSHRLVGEVQRDPRWSGRLAGIERDGIVQKAGWYAHALLECGLEVDAWETTYVHVLPGREAVLEWLKGTTLRPVLARLDEAARGDFLGELGARLARAYTERPYGTLLPFRRLFFVATRPG